MNKFQIPVIGKWLWYWKIKKRLLSLEKVKEDGVVNYLQFNHSKRMELGAVCLMRKDKIILRKRFAPIKMSKNDCLIIHWNPKVKP